MRSGLVARLGEEALGLIGVESAGTWGHVGSPMEPHAVTALGEVGMTCDDFAARELSEQMVAGADLLLAMTREHRAAVVTLQPRASRRTFTLREFNRLCAAVDPERLPTGDVVERAGALVAAAAAARGSLPPVPQQADDVPDPYGAPLALFRDAVALIADTLARPLDLLAGRRPGHRVNPR